MTASGLHSCCVQTSIHLNVRGGIPKDIYIYLKGFATCSQSLQRNGDPAGCGGVLTHRQRRHLETTLQHCIKLAATIYYSRREMLITFANTILKLVGFRWRKMPAKLIQELEHGIMVQNNYNIGEKKPEYTFWCNNVRQYPIFNPYFPPLQEPMATQIPVLVHRAEARVRTAAAQ